MNASNIADLAPDLELDGWLERFESAAGRGAAPDPADFLPDPAHPKYPAALRELLRLDLEFAWSRGDERRLDEYATRFPSLFKDPAALADVALEEGECPHGHVRGQLRLPGELRGRADAG